MASTGDTARGAMRRLRFILVALLALNLLLIGVRVVLYRPFFVQPDSLMYVLEPSVLLLIYIGVVFAVTANDGADRWRAVRTGTAMGVITGAMGVVNLTLETFVALSGAANILATAPFLLGSFALWGLAGFLGARQTRSLPLGILAALWSGMVAILIEVTYGFLLSYTALPTLERLLVNDPDFLRSHWDDLRAFAIANTFDSGFSHLLGALLIGAIVGAVGGGIGMLSARWQRHTAQ